ncbi:MAG: PrgI family protein [Candidatus Sungbacteria bacterium]|nr:PrgI family protein [Candidatus Sungbacteria bacterium]
MQQFQVPQFINVEDRIIGPLTIKQFLYSLGAAGVGLVGWRFLYLPLFILLALPVILLLLAMAFGKIDERPFPVVFINAINYIVKPRLYIWKKTHAEKKTLGHRLPPGVRPAAEENPIVALGKLSENKLSDLAWSLDIKERVEDK